MIFVLRVKNKNEGKKGSVLFLSPCSVVDLKGEEGRCIGVLFLSPCSVVDLKGKEGRCIIPKNAVPHAPTAPSLPSIFVFF